MKHSITQRPLAVLLAVSGMLAALPLVAGSLDVTHTFDNGDVADANDVNQNFADVETAVNDNDDRLTGSLAGQLTINHDDPAVTLFGQADLTAAGSGVLVVNVRSTTQAGHGWNLICGFSAHQAGNSYNVAITSGAGGSQGPGTGPGTGVKCVTGALGGDNNFFSVSITDGGGNWAISARNRLGVAVQVGWQLMAYSL